MSQVDQVTVVRKDVFRLEIILGAVLFKSRILSSVNGLLTHWRWFLVKSAKAFAPILCALTGALSTPPDALTCAPIYFMKFLFYSISNVLYYVLFVRS